MDRYSKALNPHYDFSSSENLAEIEKQAHFESAFLSGDWGYIHAAEEKELGGVQGYAKGVVIKKDWGENEVIDFYKDDKGDVCVKKIQVKSGYMLSLQSHLGRAEKWEVLSGVLTAIVDGKLYEISGQGCFDVTGDVALKISDDNHICLQKSAVHCMINRHDNPVVVKETQSGKTFESDNKRFVDQIRNQSSARATIPLISDNHFKSALLYWSIEKEIASNVGWGISFDVSNINSKSSF